MAIEDLINPKTREPIKEALRARAESEGFGKDETGKEFAEIQVVTGKFGRRVGGFITPIFDAVENNLDSLIGLRSTLPLIKETLANIDQVQTLTKADKRKAARALQLLLSFVQKQSTFQARAKQTLKNVARQKVQSIKQGMIDDLQNSPSFVKRMIGRGLDARFGEKADERKKQLLEARAQTAETLVPGEEPDTAARGRQSGRGGGLLGGLGSRQSVGDVRGLGGAGQSAAGGAHVHRTLAQILTTDKDILKQVTKLAEGTEDAADKAEQLEQATEREKEGGAKPSLVERVSKSPVVKKATGWLDSLKDMFGGGLKGILAKLIPAFGGIASIAAAVVGPALTALGSVLAVVGAAFVGWKVGEWINKMTGASDKIGDAANWVYSKLTGKETEGEHVKKANQFVIDQAWEHGGKHRFAKKEHMSLDEARKIQNEWSGLSIDDRGRMSRGEKPLGTTQAPAAAPVATPAPAPQTTAPTEAPAPPTPVAPPPEPTPAPAERVPTPPPAPPAPTKPPAPKAGGAQRLNTATLLDRIAKGEGADYDTTLGYGAYRPGGKEAERTRPITKMTVREIYQLQTAMLQNPQNKWKSSAVGRYQIVRQTLFGKGGTPENPKPGSLAAQLKLKPEDKFTPELQDSLGHLLLKGRGLEKFERGEMSAEAFQSGLAKEWASIADPTTGRSAYGQHTGTSTADLQAALVSVPPVPGRNAPALATATYAARAGVGSSGVINAPVVTTVYNTTTPAQPTVIPPAIRPKNDADSLRAVQGVNAVA